MQEQFAAKSEVYGDTLAFPVAKTGGIEGAVGIMLMVAGRVQRVRRGHRGALGEIGWSLYMIWSLAHGGDVVRKAPRVNCATVNSSTLTDRHLANDP